MYKKLFLLGLYLLFYTTVSHANCIGREYEQQMPIAGITPPELIVQSNSSSVVEGDSITLKAIANVNQDAIDASKNGKPFYVWCTEQGQLESLTGDLSQVSYTAPEEIDSDLQTIKVSVLLGDSLGYIDAKPVFINVKSSSSNSNLSPNNTSGLNVTVQPEATSVYPNYPIDVCGAVTDSNGSPITNADITVKLSNGDIVDSNIPINADGSYCSLFEAPEESQNIVVIIEGNGETQRETFYLNIIGGDTYDPIGDDDCYKGYGVYASKFVESNEPYCVKGRDKYFDLDDTVYLSRRIPTSQLTGSQYRMKFSIYETKTHNLITEDITNWFFVDKTDEYQIRYFYYDMLDMSGRFHVETYIDNGQGWEQPSSRDFILGYELGDNHRLTKATDNGECETSSPTATSFNQEDNGICIWLDVHRLTEGNSFNAEFLIMAPVYNNDFYRYDDFKTINKTISTEGNQSIYIPIKDAGLENNFGSWHLSVLVDRINGIPYYEKFDVVEMPAAPPTIVSEDFYLVQKPDGEVGNLCFRVNVKDETSIRNISFRWIEDDQEYYILNYIFKKDYYHSCLIYRDNIKPISYWYTICDTSDNCITTSPKTSGIKSSSEYVYFVDSEINSFDLEEKTVALKYDLNAPIPPLQTIAISYDNKYIYALGSYSSSENVLIIIDAKTHKELKRISLTDEMSDMVISKDNKYIYLSSRFKARLYKFDIEEEKTWVSNLPVSSINEFDINPAGDMIYAVTSTGDVLVVNTNFFSSIVEIPVSGRFYDVAFNAKNNAIYLTDMANNQVTVVDVESHNMIANIAVGMQPMAIIASNNGDKIYAANIAENTISVIDTNSHQVLDTFNVGTAPYQLNMNSSGSKLISLGMGQKANISIVNLENNNVDIVELDTRFRLGTSNRFVSGTPMDVPSAPVAQLSLAIDSLTQIKLSADSDILAEPLGEVLINGKALETVAWRDNQISIDLTSLLDSETGKLAESIDLLVLNDVKHTLYHACYPFPDVCPTEWHSLGMMYLWQQGVLPLIAGENALPLDTVNRADFVMAFVHLMAQQLNLDASLFTQPASAPLADLLATHPSAPYVQYLLDMNLDLTCDAAGNFCPDAPIVRADAIKFVAPIYAGVSLEAFMSGQQPSSLFNDVMDANAWYFPYVYTVAVEQWLHGYDDNSFKPLQALTKGEMAKLLMLATEGPLSLFPDKQPSIGDVSPTSCLLNQPTVFTLDGVNLPDTTRFVLEACSDVAALSRTESAWQFRCTPTTLGLQQGRIEDVDTGEVLYRFAVDVSEVLPTAPHPVLIDITSNSMSLSWADVAVWYELWRSSSLDGYAASERVYCGTAASYLDMGLLADTGYFYKVKAGNASASCTDSSVGWSAFSGGRGNKTKVAGSSVAPIDNEASFIWSAPAEDDLVQNASVSVDIAVQDNDGITAVNLLVLNTAGALLEKRDLGSFSGQTSVTENTAITPATVGFANNESVVLRLESSDQLGYVLTSEPRSFSWCEDITCGEPLPTAPKPELTVLNSSSIEVVWATAGSVYTLIQCSESGANCVEVYCGSDTSYLATDLASSLTYSYQLQAGNSAATCDDKAVGWSGVSGLVSGKTEESVELISQPSAAILSNITSNSIQVSWDNNASIYILLRESSLDGYSSTQQVYCGASNSFVDTGLLADTGYGYKVKAGNSSASCTDTVTGWSEPSGLRGKKTLPAPNLVDLTISPSSVILGETTIFTIKGQNLPDSIAMWIEQCADLRKLAGHSTQWQFECVPSYSTGTKVGVVKDKSGGNVLLDFSITVKAPNTSAIQPPTVTSVSPATAILGEMTVFTIKGTALPDSIAAWINQCADLRMLTGNSTQWQFECVPSYLTGINAGVIKDEPGGNVLLDFFITVEFATTTSTQKLTGNFVSLATGGHTCAANDAGQLWCWGENFRGQLGTGDKEEQHTATLINSINGVTQVAAGEQHTCALQSSGTVKCWGYNYYGQLGTGNNSDSSLPQTVNLSSGAKAIAVGFNHSCALLQSGKIQCWGGRNTPLGDGTYNASFSPVTVTGLSGTPTAITAGSSHTCALLSSGSVQCWGGNGSGQLGTGNTYTSTTPKTVIGLSGVVSITANNDQTCVKQGNGMAKCWGNNTQGALGNGGTSAEYSPVTVSNLSGVKNISTGWSHTCATTTTGSVKCWGGNWSGALGDGSTSNSSLPVTVSNLTDALSVSAGGGNSCAILSDGIQCWGRNDKGNLGVGDLDDRLSPTDVKTQWK